MNERCPKCNALLTKSNIISELCTEDARNSSLKIGDRIIELDQEPVENFDHILAHKTKGSFITVRVIRKNSKELFLMHDIPGFFSRQIKYKDICKNCDKKYKDPETKEKKKAIFLISMIFGLLVFVLIASGIFLLTSSKFNPLKHKDQDIISKLNATVNTQEINNTDYSKRITTLIKNSNIKDESLLKTALNCRDKSLFDLAYIEKYEWRKMFTLPETINILNTIIPGYNPAQLEKDRLEIISRLRCEKIGTIYFDYGEWLAPSPKYPGRDVATFNEHQYDEKRLYETSAAIANILSIIPQEYYTEAFFIIDGHTDSISAHSFNQALSERRAMYIKYIMTDIFNIPEDKIITKGFSFDKKAVSPESKKIDYAKNRRCEIQVCFFEQN